VSFKNNIAGVLLLLSIVCFAQQNTSVTGLLLQDSTGHQFEKTIPTLAGHTLTPASTIQGVC